MQTSNAVDRRLPYWTERRQEYVDPCVSGNITAVQAVLNHIPPSPQDLEDMIAIAACFNHLHLFRFLLEHPTTTYAGYHAILETCQTGSEDFILALNEKFPDMLRRNHFAGTPLTAAISVGCQPAFLEFLIDLGADLNGTNITFGSVLRFTTTRTPCEGHPSTVEILTLLLRRGARLKHSGVLCGAIGTAKARFEIVKFLLERGADPNTDILSSEFRASPPLHRAVRLGDLELVNLLLENGADPCLRPEHKDTALEISDSMARPDIRNLLNSFIANAAAKRYKTLDP
jgi:ankyrin repeat protein